MGLPGEGRRRDRGFRRPRSSPRTGPGLSRSGGGRRLARREERLRVLVDEMRRHSPKSCYRICDLSDAASFVGMLGQVEEEHSRIDILTNIAGVGGIIRSEPTTVASLRSIMEVNFIAPVAGMVTVLPGMRERKFGAIANMSSDDGRSPGPGAADYSASKAALSAATESMSYDREAGRCLPPHGVSGLGAD